MDPTRATGPGASALRLGGRVRKGSVPYSVPLLRPHMDSTCEKGVSPTLRGQKRSVPYSVPYSQSHGIKQRSFNP